MSDSFVHLHVHTEYSMLDGASRIDDLFRTAKEMGMPAVGITDHGVMYGALDFYQAGKKHGVKPILGSELYVATRSRFEKSAREKDGNFHMTAVAETTEGYQNLIKLVSIGHLEGYYYRPRVDKEVLAEHAKGIIATSGCLGSEVNQLLLQGQVEEATKVVGTYQDIFGKDNFFVELQDHGLEDQRTTFGHLIEIAKKTGAPLLATNDSHYTRKTDAGAHDVLLCIQTGATINEPGRFKFDAEEFYVKSPQEMRALFAEHPSACDNSLWIAERCDVDIEFGKLRLPPFTPPAGETVEEHLRRLVLEGAERRYGSPLGQHVVERIEHELKIIIEMGFASYFLIVGDLIGYAKRNGIRVGPGRGSAAGSVVSYCLDIVDIDPLRWGLIFERFLNPGRREMPDIDMDFDDRRRGEMIEYVAKKYGEDHVAQIVTFATIKGKQAIRDAARVLGYPYGVGDRLAKMYPPAILGKEAPLAACFDKKESWPEPGKNDAYAQATDLRKAYEEDEVSRKILDIARQLEGLRRQVSVHAAGVVISDAPLVNYTPLRRADDDRGGIVTQFEMKGVDKLGLLKMDFLGLRNLTVIEDTLAHLRRTRGEAPDIDNVPLDDRPSYEMLCRGDTVGVFQLESPGMRELVKRLKPDSFEDVMALVALYRPGPLGEGMHNEYADRKHGKRKVEYLHPDLEPILKDTYGVILYQEQVLRIATDMAGFTMAEADALRKAMGKKIADVMRAQQEKFLAGCAERGYKKELADKLWEMIDHFSGYGFNKSHSCGYAYIAYQTAYLKANFPVEYLAALLTSVKGNQDRSTLYLAECRELGITVHPPDVNVSESDYTPTTDGAIRFGLSAIRNVGENVVEEIIRARRDKGAFASFADFCRKVSASALNKRVVESLAKAGAFDALGVSRSALLGVDPEKGVVLSTEATMVVETALDRARKEEMGQFSLFGGDDDGGPDADMREPVALVEVPKDQLLAAEKEMLGVYVSEHPLLEVEAALRACTTARIPDLAAANEGALVTVGGLVTRLQKKFTRKGDPMGVFVLEDLEGAVEVVAFSTLYTAVQDLLQNDQIVCVKGRVDHRDDQPKIVASEIWRPDLEAMASGGEPLVVQLPAERAAEPGFVDRLKAVLESFPGATPVHLRLLADPGAKPKTLRSRIHVQPQSGLYAELKSLLGPRALG